MAALVSGGNGYFEQAFMADFKWLVDYKRH